MLHLHNTFTEAWMDYLINFNTWYLVWIFTALLLLIHLEQAKYSNKTKNTFFIIWIGVLAVYIGLRDIFFSIGDTPTYRDHYLSMVEGTYSHWRSRDILYEYFVRFSAIFKSVSLHFILVSLGIIIPYIVWSKKHFKRRYHWIVLLFLAHPFFLAYASNGIRFGLASSLFILGLSQSKKIFKYFLFLLAGLLHVTLFLPIIVWIIASYRKIPLWVYLFFSLFLNAFALIFKSSWYAFFLRIFPKEYFFRLHFYLEGLSKNAIQNFGGFRWDFWLYGFVYILWIVWVIYKKQWKNREFEHYAKTYVILHAIVPLFYFVVFANRFGSIAWLFIPMLLALPLKSLPTYRNFALAAFFLITTQIFAYLFILYLWRTINF